jgi:ribosomal 30S subunit maturation factor RimM
MRRNGWPPITDLRRDEFTLVATKEKRKDVHVTSSANPQPVVENIDQYLEDGMAVFDQNGERVGDVKMYSTAAGYLMVGSGAFGRQDLYIPFRLIRTIDPEEIYLSAPKDILAAQYTQPPTIHTVVETRVVPGPGGQMVARAREVHMVQSGYDGQPAAITSVDVGSLADQLAVGMAVYDVDDQRLGDITQYDTERSLLVVEKGIFKPTVLLVPFSAIKSIDRDNLTVSLSLPRDVLVKEHAMLPADA